MNRIFTQKVLAIVAGIKAGTTMTYEQVAIVAGNPKASRAVGTILKKNYNPLVPCHRVIRKDGKIGEYNRGGSEAKRKLLEDEKPAQ